ncbi:MAG: hypothetical protein RLZZ50_820 [Verrucomicrobiota bacterium]
MTPSTRRLLACVEAFAHEEEGAAGHDDWPALAGILERELAVLTRLAEERAGAPADAETSARAEALRDRYAVLGERVAEAHRRTKQELAELDQAGRRLRSVRGAYGPGRRDSGALRTEAA